MLNGLNQVKGFEQNLNGVNNVNMHTIYKNKKKSKMVWFFFLKQWSGYIKFGYICDKI